MSMLAYQDLSFLYQREGFPERDIWFLHAVGQGLVQMGEKAGWGGREAPGVDSVSSVRPPVCSC